MGRCFQPLAVTLSLAALAWIGPRAAQALEPPPPLPAGAPAAAALVKLPSAQPAATGQPAATSPVPASAPATAVLSANREILLELGKRTISLLENGQVVSSWPVAVGDPATPTPTGTFKVRNKVVNPQYQSTKSGKNNPTVGPQGPLGYQIGRAHV